MNTIGRVPPEAWALGQPVRDACRAAAEGGDGGHVLDLLAPATYSAAYREKFANELAARRRLVASIPKEWFGGLEVLLGCLEDLDLIPVLDRIQAPTLVLAGGEDLTFPVQHSQILASSIPGARLQIVPHGSHAMAIEEPDVIVEAISRFLTEADTHG
jgi:pimeloyl-ACP methyl ester carboxylesterase